MTTGQFTTFLLPNLLMTKYTQERRTQQLIEQVMQHSHKEEILLIMQDQLLDDSATVSQPQEEVH